MKVLKKNIEEGKVTVSILAEPEEFIKALSDAYMDRTDTMPVPGYAPGLAPREEIEKIYGENILFDEAVDILVPQLYREFLKEAGIRTVGKPELTKVTWQEEPGFSFEVEAGLMPEVKLGKYKGISCPYKREDKETFEGYVLARACENMQTVITDALVDIRLDALIAEEKMKIGQDPVYYVLADSVFALREGYYLAEVYRSKAQIDAEAMDLMLQTVSKDNEKVDPQHFIDLVREMAGRYHTVPEDFDKKLGDIMKKRSDRKKKMSPDELLEEAFKAYLGSVEMDEKRWRDLHRSEAAGKACIDLLLGAVADEEKLTVSDSEFMEKVSEIAEQTGLEMDEVIPQIDRESICSHMLREKAEKLILESAVEADE